MKSTGEVLERSSKYLHRNAIASHPCVFKRNSCVVGGCGVLLSRNDKSISCIEWEIGNVANVNIVYPFIASSTAPYNPLS